ncbi:IS1634 family transposase, partial [Desulfonatronospira sp.]|uniref:IS1634 family transposase n=1 Tax=Desulfonatronospira sp. TaxID=1962951 RepID=UPI0025C2DF60
AFAAYGLKVGNINYDTTSKVMWGEYRTWNHLEDYGEEVSYIAIDFGYSKDKRNDKKQIKIGLGTTNGIVTDAKVLSGNTDDKTYNKENLEDLDRLLKTMKVDRDDFYYIADSALFSATNIEKANQNGIQFITRMPDNTKLARQLLATALPEEAQLVEIENARGTAVSYELIETEVLYNEYQCKAAVVYSHALKETKQKSTNKKVGKEQQKVTRSIKKYKKRTFKCRPDAEKEIELLHKKLGSKLKFHELEFEINELKIRRPGRPSKNPEDDIARIEFQLVVTVVLNEDNVAEELRKQCTFILCSNDLALSGAKMLREYKTQSDVEKRFRNLKSPKYMNSVFLKTPKRVEAVIYLLLIGLMLLTIAEMVVREGLKRTNDLVYGIERRKQKRPTLTSILQIMERIQVVTYSENGKPRRIVRSIDESCLKIISFLGFTVSDFAWEEDGFDSS